MSSSGKERKEINRAFFGGMNGRDRGRGKSE